uniref:Serine/threonine-protein phosphatase 1 regulatory subunit 10 n=1 Tax=Auxenochlorella protothecoides TaxID=3075 RepID=A0A1D1ZY36_AUXPR
MQALAVVAASAQGTVGAVEEAPAPRPKRPASPTSSGDDSGRPSRKRVDLFPRIPRAARCGECENCLNPQRKKACSAARARLAAATQEGGGGGVTTAPAPSAAPAPPPPDQFITSLQTILAGSGGVVAERHATALTTLLSRAASLAHRSALLTVLQLSSDEVLAAVVRGGGVGPLERWLAEAVAGVKPRVVAKLLAALARMPVSLTVLRAGELGKSVGRLRKHPGFDAGVQAQAKALVASWKMMVDAAGGAAAETAARPMDSQPAVHAPAPRPAPPAAQSRPLPSLAPAAAPVPKAEPYREGSPRAPEATDLFAEEMAQRAAPVKKAPPRVTTTVHAATPDDRGPSSPPSATAAAAAGASASVTSTSRVGSSPFDALDSLGSVSSHTSSFLDSGVGDLPRGAYTPYTAAQRAAAAAQRVPSPEPAPRRAKAKSVRWVEEDRVAAVRWFLAADPPAAVQQDADPDAARAALVAAAAEGTEAAAIAPGPGPSAALTSAPADAAPRFESAARLEHLSEASVLRAHRLQEDAELEEMAERLAGMLPVMAWRPPPGVAAAAAAAAAGQGIAAGEESAEAGEALARREQSRTARAHYPRGLLDCPACAEEPGDGWSRGEWEARHPPLRIPLSVEEAAAAAAATRQAPPQQQQPPQLAPFGGARDPPISQRDTFQNRPPPQQQHYQGGGTPAGHRTPHGQPPPPPAPPPPLNLNFGALDQLLRGMRSGPALDSGPPAPGGAIRHAPEGPAPMGFQGQGYGHGPPNMQAHPPAENSRGFAPAGAWPQGLVQPTPGPPPPRPPSEPLSGRQAHRQGGHGLKPLPHVRCKFFFGPKGCRQGADCRFSHVP